MTELTGLPVSNTLEEGTVWITTTLKFKGFEAKAGLLIDVEVSKLTDAVMQHMIYIVGSWANTCLKVTFYEDVNKIDYQVVVDLLQEQLKSNLKKVLLKFKKRRCLVHAKRCKAAENGNRFGVKEL